MARNMVRVDPPECYLDSKTVGLTRLCVAACRNKSCLGDYATSKLSLSHELGRGCLDWVCVNRRGRVPEGLPISA